MEQCLTVAYCCLAASDKPVASWHGNDELVACVLRQLFLIVNRVCFLSTLEVLLPFERDKKGGEERTR